ncbi:MAG: CoA transferase [Burkholderiales bacterium]|nr:CoA transferase [Burkholderiales bacterium]
MSPPGRPKERSLAQEGSAGPARSRALADVRIVEFGGYAAGPHIGKILANFGATVVHVESKARPDGFRLQYPPFQDGKPGIDASGCFAHFNDSKFGVTVDLKSPAGIAAARRLTDWCDVVIENMRPGVMDRIGLGYAALAETNPGLVMLSTCNMGQTGPRADTPGFGSQLTALAGMCHLTGIPDGPPMLLYGPYIDYIASTLGASAVLAALERRRRTGRGACIDVSQYECGLMFLAGPLLEYHRSGRIAERAGNTDPEAAPHGAYPACDGGWLALSCWSDAEFASLAGALGRPALAADARYATRAARQANAAALDAEIAEWTRVQDASAAAKRLQAAGVHAHPVSTIADLFTDPQLVQRNLWRARPHAVFGEQVCGFPAFDLSETPGEITRAAPRLGEHTEHVFREFLGMSADEYRVRAVAGAFD